ncbi:hypothetical protein ACOBQX_05745 [Actinokineospora sp. G85]|uniref:hypothetical protein n=1 Tax=Actinokineospora sp. G85 TaxID=3406626 RepID=UPI003C71B2D7
MRVSLEQVAACRESVLESPALCSFDVAPRGPPRPDLVAVLPGEGLAARGDRRGRARLPDRARGLSVSQWWD